MVTISVNYPQRLRPQSSGSLWQRSRSRQRGAWYFEQDLRRLWQWAAHCYQCASCANVQGGREFQKLLTSFVAAADKDRNG